MPDGIGIDEEDKVKTKSNQAMDLATFDLRINEQNMNELYKEYHKKMYCLAFSYVKDRYLAEDLAHDILIKCYLSREKYNGNCSFYTWMYRVAINHCIDFLRKGSRQRDIPHEEIEVCNIEERRTPETEVLMACENEELRTKLKQLPSKYEEVLTLYYFQDQSLKEIENHLSTNLSTIKTRLFRAKRMLREMY